MIIVDPQIIETINKELKGKKIYPIQLKTGEWVVRDEILSDSVTWGAAIAYLSDCDKRKIEPNEFKNQ